MSRAELLERYRALPMPTTSDESWRFTDLKGFDPDAFAVNGSSSESDSLTRQGIAPMLDIDVAGFAQVGAGVDIEHAPDARGSVGMIENRPNSRNVIPGEVLFAIDLRHPEESVLDVMETAVVVDGPGAGAAAAAWPPRSPGRVPRPLCHAMTAITSSTAALAARAIHQRRFMLRFAASGSTNGGGGMTVGCCRWASQRSRRSATSSAD